MIEICALASGSNGNCYYVGNEYEAVIIDVGISNRQILKRMKAVGLDIKKVKAAFISHEHSDHVKGFRVFCDMNGIAGYITKRTMFKAAKDYIPSIHKLFTPGDIIKVGNITVHTFEKYHDGIEPASFRVEIDNKNIGVITDIGKACNNVKKHIKECNAVFLETNYDELMLRNGSYPYFLKQRITSGEGHISNREAVELVSSITNSPLNTIILSHLSKENNNIDIAMREFAPLSDRFNIIPTSRYEPTEVIVIN